MENDNFDKALACLDKVYSRDDECRINVIDKVIFQNWKDVSVFKLMERVTEWEINIGVLKSRFDLDLLNPNITRLTADILLSKFNEDIKNRIIENLDVDYPSVEQILQKVPSVVKRSSKDKNHNLSRTVNTNTVTSPKNLQTKKCWFCEKIHETKIL